MILADICFVRDHLLRFTIYPNELQDAGRDIDAPLAEVNCLAKSWATSSNWRKAEDNLNKFPQFQTDIAADSFDPVIVHFIHVKSKVEGAIPLLFVQCWPGSFLESIKIIKPLTESNGKQTPVFDVVIPSLPNFGLSDAVEEKGFSVDQHGEVLHKLMLRLRYDECVSQGGNWGAFLTRAMTSRYSPRHLKAQHLNLCFFGFPSFRQTPLLALQATVTPFTKSKKEGFARTTKFFIKGNGYEAIQSTRPQTLVYGLTDSPLGLLAWAYQKLHDWSDGYPWTDEEICTLGSASTGSQRQVLPLALYYEFQKDIDVNIARLRSWMDVKTRALGHTIFEKEHQSGGHFAAWEKPDYILADLEKMLGSGRGVEGLIRTA
ncbi:alpha/beta-hydrolase [Xylariaceae sp. FL0255]|nr:alpha/beta-hydrolase [Xylariaceae sp. FL0255]